MFAVILRRFSPSVRMRMIETDHVHFLGLGELLASEKIFGTDQEAVVASGFFAGIERS